MGCESLAERIHALASSGLDDRPQRAASNALLRASETAIEASAHDAVQKLRSLASQLGGAKVAPLAGSSERTDAYFSSLINGTAAGRASFGPLLALIESSRLDGRRALAAFAIGLEIELRLERIVSPSVFEAGWDAKAVCGVIGASVAAGLLLDLDRDGLREAIGIAASETVGHREAWGTDSGALQRGKAASNGTIAALLARRGFTGSQSLDAYAGFFTVFPPSRMDDIDALAGDLGERWELERNESPKTAKPASPALIEAVRSLEGAPSGVQFVAALTGATG